MSQKEERHQTFPCFEFFQSVKRPYRNKPAEMLTATTASIHQRRESPFAALPPIQTPRESIPPQMEHAPSAERLGRIVWAGIVGHRGRVAGEVAWGR